MLSLSLSFSLDTPLSSSPSPRSLRMPLVYLSLRHDWRESDSVLHQGTFSFRTSIFVSILIGEARVIPNVTCMRCSLDYADRLSGQITRNCTEFSSIWVVPRPPLSLSLSLSLQTSAYVKARVTSHAYVDLSSFLGSVGNIQVFGPQNLQIPSARPLSPPPHVGSLAEPDGLHKRVYDDRGVWDTASCRVHCATHTRTSKLR
ncbi:hypothetical protein F4775DRAFT_135568 [Biscogniauxia sp. FL1348]|nr:hypothetical protein F4775DRAFT_135568 [Biscogniauxia sp. FL1348]